MADIDIIEDMLQDAYIGYRIERGLLYDFIITDCDVMLPDCFIQIAFTKEGFLSGMHPRYKDSAHG